ncbi:MAG: HEPN domain-containing protein [Microscillaceae bacterium]|nr:HEPN domain-containing protein [Microscillaceae bacterium]
MNESFDGVFNILKNYLDNLYAFFSGRYTPNVRPDDSYYNDLKAYTLLSHAAIEDFFEDIAKRVLVESIKQWINENKLNDTILSSIKFIQSKQLNEVLISLLRFKIENKKKEKGNFYVQFKSLLDEIENGYKKKLDDNNGIRPEKLEKLFEAVGLDISDDPRLRTSLVLLADARGDFAHKKKPDNSILKYANFEDMKNRVDDVLEICRKVIDQINT